MFISVGRGERGRRDKGAGGRWSSTQLILPSDQNPSCHALSTDLRWRSALSRSSSITLPVLGLLRGPGTLSAQHSCSGTVLSIAGGVPSPLEAPSPDYQGYHKNFLLHFSHCTSQRSVPSVPSLRPQATLHQVPRLLLLAHGGG